MFAISWHKNNNTKRLNRQKYNWVSGFLVPYSCMLAEFKVIELCEIIVGTAEGSDLTANLTKQPSL